MAFFASAALALAARSDTWASACALSCASAALVEKRSRRCLPSPQKAQKGAHCRVAQASASGSFSCFFAANPHPGGCCCVGFEFIESGIHELESLTDVLLLDFVFDGSISHA